MPAYYVMYLSKKYIVLEVAAMFEKTNIWIWIGIAVFVLFFLNRDDKDLADCNCR